MRENHFCVYAHVLFDGRLYIGITGQKPERRWREGAGYRKKGNKQSYFYNSIMKYGWDSFKHIILASGLTEEEAKQAEIKLISIFRTQDRNFGFNESGGGEGNFNPSEETRRKIGEISKKVNTGRKQTEENKKRESERMKRNNPNAGGKALTAEAIERFTEYAKKPKTKNQRLKMSQSAKKRPIVCVETGTVYESMKQAADMMGVYYTAISCAVYDGKRKSCGYHWRYYEGL